MMRIFVYIALLFSYAQGDCNSQCEYQPEGEDMCYPCPSNSRSEANNQTTCLCDHGYYAIPFDLLLLHSMDPEQYEMWYIQHAYTSNSSHDANADLDFFCVSCPSGADCMRMGTTIQNVTPYEGYFMGFDGTGQFFYPCFNNACYEGFCAAGYTGLACTECTDGLTQVDFDCVLCPNAIISIVTFLVVTVLPIALITRSLNNSDEKDLNTKHVFFKIFVSTIQTTGLSFLSSDFLTYDYLKIIYDVSVLFTADIQLQCILGVTTGFTSNNFFYLLLLPILGAVVFLVVSLSDAIRKPPIRTGSPLNFAIMFMLALGYVLYPTLVFRVMDFFNCVEMGYEMYFLVDNLSIMCYSSAHFAMMIVSILAYSVYVIALPFGLYKLLSKHVEHIRQINTGHFGQGENDQIKGEFELNRFYRTYALFFAGYNNEYYFWEGVVILRKASVVFFTALIVSNYDSDWPNPSYVWPCAFTLVCFTFAQIHCKPFVLQRLNHFEAMSLVFTVVVSLTNLTMYAAVFFNLFFHLVYFIFSAVMYCRFRKSLSQDLMVKASVVPAHVGPSGHKDPDVPDYSPVGILPIGTKDVAVSEPSPPTEPSPPITS